MKGTVPGWPREKKASKTTTNYHHISEPYPGLFYVRFARENSPRKLHKRFSKAHHGSRTLALQAALTFRDKEERQTPALFTIQRVNRIDRSKLTTDTQGVCKLFKPRQLSSGETVVDVQYTTRYFLKTPKRTRYKAIVFHLGRADLFTSGQDEHAYKTAVFARKMFEKSLADKRVRFNPLGFSNWKNVAHYKKGRPIIVFDSL